MKRWNLLETATTPDGNAMTLHEHDGDYVIRVDNAELMSTRRFASEVGLADVACADLRSRPGVRVLIGGLGMSFTLRAALKHLRADAQIVVAELLPIVVDWNRNPAYKLGADVLSDPRVRIEVRDVGDLITAEKNGFDAIMLDVDNGARAMTSEGNKRLYLPQGLSQARRALREHGCVVYWSADEDPRFEEAMRKQGFSVEVRKVRAHATSGGTHVLFIGHRE